MLSHTRAGSAARFWAACKPGVKPEDPVTEFELIRGSMVPCAEHVLLDQEDVLRVIERAGAWAQITRVFRAVWGND